MRGLAAAALACVALCACVGPAAAIDWCEPRQLATQMPCPNATHCCSVWGFCGPGTHFCQPGHCAGGPCQGAPLDLSNQRRPPPRASPPPPPRASRPPPPRASPAPSMPPKQPSNPFELPADTSMEVEEDPTGLGGGAGGSSQPTPDSLPPTLNPALTPPLLPLPLIPEVCGLAQPDIDLWGSDLPEGRIGEVDNLELCCDACRARVGCGAYTYNPRRRMCYLKRGAGHNRRVREGWASALMPGPSPPPSPPPPLSPPPPPPPPAPALPQLPTCGFVQDNIDLFGADLVNGTIEGETNMTACCAACKARPDCDTYTFVSFQRRCYLKSSIAGFEVRLAPGMQSAVKPVGPSIAAAPARSPPPPPQAPPPPPQAEPRCGPVEDDVDLFGADLPNGTLDRIGSAEACCSRCTDFPGCGAFTYAPRDRRCYLKRASEFAVLRKKGMQSAVMVTPTPELPAPPPPRPPPPSPPPADPYAPGPYKFVELTAEQKRRMYQLTSIFENADTNLQYGFAKRLGDDRGVTYGFCGFTTGTDDGFFVVDEYTGLKANNTLARWLPALRRLRGKGDRFEGLDGFDAAVRLLASDKEFIAAQWTICDKEYHLPAMEWCRRIQCRHAITKAQLHDALVNHGQGRNSKFSVDWLIDSANTAAGGTPGTGVDETKWLRAFLKARYDLLFNWDPVARVSVKRIEIYRKLLDTGNLKLGGPIYIDLVRRTQADGTQVWQIRDAYYGTFMVYNDPDPDRKLALLV